MTELRAAPDPWLSRCLNVPCFGVKPGGSTPLDQIIAIEGPVFITARTAPDDKTQRDRLQTLGFVTINQQITFRWACDTIPKAPERPDITFMTAPAAQRDPGLKEFAPLFATDRFHSDMRLPRDWSLRIKTYWITAPDSGKLILTATIGSKIAGFILVHPTPQAMIIDLIAVAPAYQGQGVGVGLLRHLQTTLSKDYDIFVGTQHDNLAAQHLYLAAGFKRAESKGVHHYYRER